MPACVPLMPCRLWLVCFRPLQDKTLSLDGVILQLPQPELEYIIAAAKQSSDFVVELAGKLSRTAQHSHRLCGKALANYCNSVAKVYTLFVETRTGV